MDEEQMKKCEAERDEYLASWKRAAADLINYKKDEGKRFAEFADYNMSRIIKDFLPALDSFAALEQSAQGEPRPEVAGRDLEGIRAIKNQLEDILKKQNVERIPVAAGDSVDLNIHEPVVVVESTDHPELAGKVVGELSPGYKLNNKVIRAAKVKIGK